MRRIAAVFAIGILCGVAREARAFDLEGNWYVLVHYKDADTNKPDQWRWEDRVWKFERKGDRLEWTDYPIVVFEDETGRFEKLSGNRASRVLAAWEPSPMQLQDIKNGLQTNPRGVKTKTLRSVSNGTGWTSGEGSASTSEMVVAYNETWSIEGLPARPTFTRVDSMGAAGAESMEGRTRYAVEADKGDELTGSFDRDGTRKGTFEMFRSGETEGLKTASKSESDLQRKTFQQNLQNSGEMRALVRERVATDLAQRGMTASDAEIDKLTDQALDEARRTGSADGAEKAFVAQATQLFYAFAPRGAKHDDTVRYRFPFDPSTPRQLGQGVGGYMGHDLFGNEVSSPQGNPASHVGAAKYGFDWGTPPGTSIVAARDGEIARVVDGAKGSGPARSTPANAVYIKHADGTYAEYIGLAPGIPVQPGQKVKAGDVIGKSGPTGGWWGMRPGGVHFAVGHLNDAGEPETVPIRYANGTKDGFVPEPGSYYGSDGRATKTEPVSADVPDSEK
jgi:murein DD-endopeptidase MepM/ murein hydrolase activator NlpD